MPNARTMLIVSLAILFAIAPRPASAEPIEDSSARTLEPLYARIGGDLRAGRPLIIHAYYGMWQARADEPDRNLNWGVYYGHKTMMERARRDKSHIRKLYQYRDWRLVHEREATEDPLRVLVFHQRARPSAAWKKAGVTEPFDVYLVMEAWADQQGAARAMVAHLRQGVAPPIAIEGSGGAERALDVSRAHAVGYFGHNFFYDYEDFDYQGLDRIEGEVEEATGVFAVGCKTARVPGFGRLLTDNVSALLYSKTLMASEGYSTLSLAEGLIARMTSGAMVRHANKTYRYFQSLGKPGRRVGRPFVGEADRD